MTARRPLEHRAKTFAPNNYLVTYATLHRFSPLDAPPSVSVVSPPHNTGVTGPGAPGNEPDFLATRPDKECGALLGYVVARPRFGIPRPPKYFVQHQFDTRAKGRPVNFASIKFDTAIRNRASVCSGFNVLGTAVQSLWGRY